MSICKACKWLKDESTPTAIHQSCAFPLPAWLDAHLFWQEGGTRVRVLHGIGYADCPTYEAAK